MKRISFILVFCIVCIFSYAQSPLFNIKGKAKPQFNGKNVTLLSYDGMSYKRIGTAKVQNGIFSFKGRANPGHISMVVLDKYSEPGPGDTYAEVILEKGIISLVLDKESSANGTPLNNLYQEYKTQYKSFSKQHVDFIKKNAHNAIGRRAFVDHHKELSDEEVKEIMAVKNNSFKRDSKVAVCLQSRAIMSNKKKDDLVRENLKGNKYQDFRVYTPSGEEKKLSNYVGKSKYVVMNFWASWCTPGIKGMPHMKMLLDKYKNKNLKFIGISLDSEGTKADWILASNSLNVPWDQLSDLKGSESILSKAYGVSDVPYSVVIDEKGIIVDCVRFPGRNLESVLEKLP